MNQQKNQPAQQDQQIAQRDGYRRPDHRKDQRRIRRDPRQNFSGHDLFVKRRTHPDHAVKDGDADVGHHTFTKARHKVITQARANREQERKAQGGGKVTVQQFFGRGFETIDDTTHGNRQDQRNAGGQHQCPASGEHHRPIAPDERPKRP